MKIKELKVLVDQYNDSDPELEVCYFHDLGPLTLDNMDIYEGAYENPDNQKTILLFKIGQFVGIGNPSNFEIETPLTLRRNKNESID